MSRTPTGGIPKPTAGREGQGHGAADRWEHDEPEVFRPTTVVSWPALMAVFRDPNAATAIEVERYLFGESGIVYDFELRAPVATWATDAAVMRGVLQSFFLPGG